MSFLKKKQMGFHYAIPFLLGIILFPLGSLFSAEVIEVPISTDDANVKILAILNKINPDDFYEDNFSI
jgi:hypothetical protein